MKMTDSDLIAAWEAAGNKPTVVEAVAMDPALKYSPFSAYGRTMRISTLGRKKFNHSVKVTGAKI